MAEECGEGEEQLAESVASKRLGKRVDAILNTINHKLTAIERDYVRGSDGDDTSQQHTGTITYVSVYSITLSLSSLHIEETILL